MTTTISARWSVRGSSVHTVTWTATHTEPRSNLRCESARVAAQPKNVFRKSTPRTGQTCQLLLITCYTFSMNKPTRRTKEQQRFIMEIRRSSAASPHKNKSRYTRKDKHKGRAQDHS